MSDKQNKALIDLLYGDLRSNNNDPGMLQEAHPGYRAIDNRPMEDMISSAPLDYYQSATKNAINSLRPYSDLGSRLDPRYVSNNIDDRRNQPFKSTMEEDNKYIDNILNPKPYVFPPEYKNPDKLSYDAGYSDISPSKSLISALFGN